MQAKISRSGLAGYMAIAMTCVWVGQQASADPTAVEAGCSLTRTWTVNNVWSVAYNPQDGLVYAVERTSTGGVYRLNADGTTTQVINADRAGGLAFDPKDGDMFIAEDYDGKIYRFGFGETTRSTWASGFDSGDDDIAGLAIVPLSYTGGVVAPGSALTTDRGYGTSDEIWLWSPDSAENETEIINDFATLSNPYDIAVNDTRIVIIDGDTNGQLFELQKNSSDEFILVEIATQLPLANPEAAVFDPLTGDLLVTQYTALSGEANGSVVRVDLNTGAVSTVISGLNAPRWGSLDITPDGQTLFIGANDSNTVYEFAIPEPTVLSLLALGGLTMIRRNHIA